jgi:hypothetical protein
MSPSAPWLRGSQHTVGYNYKLTPYRPSPDRGGLVVVFIKVVPVILVVDWWCSSCAMVDIGGGASDRGGGARHDYVAKQLGGNH